MIKKLAVLIVEKADGSVETSIGEKGDIYQKGRELKRKLNDDEIHDVFRVTAVGTTGVLVQAKWKKNSPPDEVVEVATESVEEIPEEIEDDQTDASADVAAIRAALKAKDVKVPPRISVDKLIEMAIAHGVEV